MRYARALALVACLAVSATAAAEEPAVVQPDAQVVAVVDAPPAAAPASRPLPWLGVMADVGIPDGVQGSLVLRPWKALRASIGGGYNMISKGVRVGVTLLPLYRGPSATLEAGHYFDGDGTAAAARFFGAGFADSVLGPAFQHMGYDYVNAHLGLDFGYKRATFYIHGGMSYVEWHVRNFAQIINSSTPTINGEDASGRQITVPQGATFKYLGPSGKVGLIIYFG